MIEYLTQFEQVLILYAPVLLAYITQVVDWVVTLKKFRSLSVGKQVEPVLNAVKETNRKVAELQKEIKEFYKEKTALTSDLRYLNKINQMLTDELKDVKVCLNNLSIENIELKAKLREKNECVKAIELKPV